MVTRPKNVSHPGVFVRKNVLEPLGLNVSEAAKVLGITRPALSNFLNERACLSPEMAIRLDKAFGIDMEMLMRMQSRFDIAQAKRREAEIRVAPYVANRGGGPQQTLG